MNQPFISIRPWCAACLIWTVILAGAAHARNWTDSKGRQIEALYVRVSEADVILQRGNKVDKVPFVNLSDADQAFVQNKLKESGKLALLPPTDTPRLWTDDAGNQTMAAYVRLEEAGEEPLVVIRRDNDALSLPFDKFSKEDQDYVRGQLATQGKRSRLLPPDENPPPAVAAPGTGPAPMSNLARQMQARRERQAEARRQLDEQQRLAQQQREQAQAEALRLQQERKQQEQQRQLAAEQEYAPRSTANEIQDAAGHCGFKLADGWQHMSQKELDMINSSAAALGSHYIDGARPHGSKPGMLPYLLVQMHADSFSNATHEELEKAFADRWRVEAAKGGFASYSPPKMDREHDRLILRNRIRHPDGRTIANTSIVHFGKTHAMVIHTYDNVGAIEGRMPTFMAMSNTLHFDPGFEFAPPQTQVSVFGNNGQSARSAANDPLQFFSSHLVEIAVGLVASLLVVVGVVVVIVKLAHRGTA